LTSNQPALTIGPRSLEGEDVTCRFTNVVRGGEAETLASNGDLAGGSGPDTVFTTEVNERLIIRHDCGGNVMQGFTRCLVAR
jgi:hypothetical protein